MPAILLRLARAIAGIARNRRDSRHRKTRKPRADSQRPRADAHLSLEIMPCQRMTFWLLASLLWATGAATLAAQTPRWQTNLTQNSGLESFDRPASAVW